MSAKESSVNHEFDTPLKKKKDLVFTEFAVESPTGDHNQNRQSKTHSTVQCLKTVRA